MARNWNTPAISKINANNTSYWVKDSEVRAILETYAETNCAAQKSFTTTVTAAGTDLPTSAAVWNAIHAIPSLKYQVFTTLPAPSSDYDNVIGLVPDEDSSAAGAYIEYLCIHDSACDIYYWEKIGTTATDLAAYAKWGTYSGTATTTVVIPTGGTSSNGGVTVDFASNAGFRGTAATISSTVNDYVTGISVTGAGEGTVHDVTAAELAATPVFTGTQKTLTINFNDDCDDADLHDIFVTDVSTSAAPTTSLSYLKSVGVSTTAFTGTAANISTNINAGTNKDVVTGLTTTAASTTSKTFVKSVGVQSASFNGTEQTVTLSNGSTGNHYHTIPLDTDTITVLTAHTPATFSANVANEELSFSFNGGSATTKSHEYFSSIGGDDCGEAATESATVNVSVSGKVTPTGSVSVTLTPTTESFTYVAAALGSVSASYTAKTLTSNSYTPQGTVSVTLNPTSGTQQVVTSAISSASPQYAAKTLVLNYTPEGTVSKPAINLTSSTKTFISSVSGITLTKGNKTISASYTPAGSITGSQTISSHTHTVATQTAPYSGTVSVNIQSA